MIIEDHKFSESDIEKVSVIDDEVILTDYRMECFYLHKNDVIALAKHNHVTAEYVNTDSLNKM